MVHVGLNAGLESGHAAGLMMFGDLQRRKSFDTTCEKRHWHGHERRARLHNVQKNGFRHASVMHNNPSTEST